MVNTAKTLMLTMEPVNYILDQHLKHTPHDAWCQVLTNAKERNMDIQIKN